MLLSFLPLSLIPVQIKTRVRGKNRKHSIGSRRCGAPYDIKWSNGATTDTVTVSPSITTTYTVTVTDASGCQSTAQVTINVTGALEVNITPDPA
jgi:hypothetical protein